MTPEQLNNVLEQHKLWLGTNGAKGQRADLTSAYLVDADLTGANLTSAILTSAILTRTKHHDRPTFLRNS